MKNKNILIGIISLVLIFVMAGAGCSRIDNKESLPKASDEITNDSSKIEEPAGPVIDDPTGMRQTVQNVAINYTDNGFSPSVITINKGDTVTFKNNSSKTFWPAANPHPIHTSLLGFDAKKALGDGQSYSYTFTKTSTIKYHNHLSPSEGGTIIIK